MYVHISQEFFERRPFWGVVLGLGSLVFFVVIWAGLYREYAGFAASPENVDLRTVTPPTPDRGRWVRIHEKLQVRCDAVQELNDLEKRIFFGKVAETYYWAPVPNSTRILLLEYEGDYRCPAQSGGVLIGVLEELRPRRRAVLAGYGLVFPSNVTVLKLCVTCSPSKERRLLYIGLLLPFTSLFILYRYWPKYRQQQRRSEMLEAHDSTLVQKIVASATLRQPPAD
jgi:hypothetical protein